jgi:deoxycytidylate deaminase
MTCAKQTVTATIITPEGHRWVGTNFALNPQPACPRGDAPTGTGYELCNSICRQLAHAEINALAAAGSEARGCVLFLEGHTYACEPCRAACRAAVIVEIVLGGPPA